MRRSVCARSSGGQDKKSTTSATVKLSKLRSSSRITELHHKNNMPVYNIIARRHKVFNNIRNAIVHLSIYLITFKFQVDENRSACLFEVARRMRHPRSSYITIFTPYTSSRTHACWLVRVPDKSMHTASESPDKMNDIAWDLKSTSAQHKHWTKTINAMSIEYTHIYSATCSFVAIHMAFNCFRCWEIISSFTDCTAATTTTPPNRKLFTQIEWRIFIHNHLCIPSTFISKLGCTLA